MSESKLINELLEKTKLKNDLKDHFYSGDAAKPVKEAMLNLALLITHNEEAMEALNLVHESLNKKQQADNS